ncbi:MAG TPA: hypothetical protein VMH30_05960 [Verrucomicrobiae bacterium]|nr:hypothetical protein [Verrucomicrobiae bacterium]
MTFLDTGILVGAVLKSHSEHGVCLAALEDSERPFTNAHALAGIFPANSTSTRSPHPSAPCKTSVGVEALMLADYETAIREAHSRGVMGGGIYDSLHATFARRKKAVHCAYAKRALMKISSLEDYEQLAK